MLNKPHDRQRAGEQADDEDEAERQYLSGEDDPLQQSRASAQEKPPLKPKRPKQIGNVVG